MCEIVTKPPQNPIGSEGKTIINKHSHGTIMEIVHLDAVKIDCTAILCDECQDLNACVLRSPTVVHDTIVFCELGSIRQTALPTQNLVLVVEIKNKQMNRMCETRPIRAVEDDLIKEIQEMI